MPDFIEELFKDPTMLTMGHGQRLEDNNLGLGWMYYGLGRIIKPQLAVCIGSWRGFVPYLMAKSMQDNLEKGEMVFIDPSMVDDFWVDPDRVTAYFSEKGVENISHHRYTTQEFVNTEAYQALDNIGFLMIDGYHTAEQARIDYLAFAEKLTPDAVVMFHDSTHRNFSKMYGNDRIYRYDVIDFISHLKTIPGLEVFNLPISSGVTLLRGKPESLELV